MKKNKTTRISLAYVYGTKFCTLFKAGDGTLKSFERKHGFAMTVGAHMACYPKTSWEVGRYWMVHFHHAVIRDKIDPIALHETLMDIPEFRRFCAYDIPLMEKYDF